MKTAVIGGGISGLAEAYLLKKKGYAVTLFEKSSATGGNIFTEHTGGYMLEHGPNSTLNHSEINNLITSLGIESKLSTPGKEAKKRYILKGGKLIPLPSAPLDIFSTKIFSGMAKLKIFKEPFIGPSGLEDESVASFIKRRLGKEFLDYIVNPFIAGIYAGDPEELSIRSAFPMLYEMEKKYGSLVKGAVRMRSEKKREKQNDEEGAAQKKNSSRTISFTDGMLTLVDALNKELEGNIFLNSEVSRIEKADGKFKVMVNNAAPTHTDFDNVIISTRADAAGSIINELDPELTKTLNEIYYPPLAVIFTAFKKENIGFNLDGFGFLVPSLEKRNILGALFSSVLFPNRAPEGMHLITSFIGGMRQPELALQSNEQILGTALTELRNILNINGEPEFSKVKKWNKAIPQYRPGYFKITEAIENFQNTNTGIYFCSNFYKGISVAECVKNAYTLQNKLNVT